MLIEFSVGNYRSFKDIQTLHLQAANIRSKDRSLDEQNIFSATEKFSLLKSKAIYGANASGKSNIILALEEMQAVVSSSFQNEEIVEKTWRGRFRLSEDDGSPIFFQIIFSIEKTIYRYGFEILDEEIHTEWLYGIPKEKEVYFFEREGMSIKLNSNQFKEGKRAISAHSNELPLYTQKSLFLTVVAAYGPLASMILDELKKIKILSSSSIDLNEMPSIRESLKDAEKSKKISAILNGLDSGIEGIIYTNYGDFFKLDWTNWELGTSIERLKELNEKIITTRKKYDANGKEIGQAFFFLDTEEAEGNKKLVALSPFLIEAFEKGSTLVIDEFDAHLHPNLTRKIVELFQNSISNPKNAQLIFATHDSNLLDATLLRRDQICFVEKDKFGASRLTNLVEFKGVRNDASYEKEYLKGRYGAVPYLGKFERAFEN